MKQAQRNAWIEAAKEQILRDAKKEDDCTAELMMLYDECAHQLETEIRAFFDKYAVKNLLSEAEASKHLSGSEFKSWRKTLTKYVAEAKEAGTGSRIALELETLAAKSQLSRKEKLLSSVYHNMARLAGTSTDGLKTLLSDLVRSNYERRSYDIQSIGKVGFEVGKLDEGLVRQVLEYPWSGKNFSRTLWDNTDQLAALARKEIARGFVLGSSVDKMARAIDEVMQKGRYAAQRVVRTESSYFSNQGQILAYREAGVKKYRWLGGGCEDCAMLNGQIFDIEEARTGETLPPMHPNCKCTTVAAYDVPIFKARYGNPLEKSTKFAEWKKRHMGDSAGVIPATSLSGVKSPALEAVVLADGGKDDILKQETPLTKALAEGRVKLKVNRDLQGRHMKADKRYIEGRSYLYGDMEEAQKLVDKLHGTGTLLTKHDSGEWNHHERVRNDEPIGVFVDMKSGREEETTNMIIHYSRTGTHVVPARSSKEAQNGS